MITADILSSLSVLIIIALIIVYLGGLLMLANKGHWLWLLASVLIPPLAVLGFILNKNERKPGVSDLVSSRKHYANKAGDSVKSDLRALFIPQKNKGGFLDELREMLPKKKK